MTYETDEKLKSFLDTNQLYRERMCLAILSIDKRFSDVRPRHPRGGPDGARDIEAVFQDELAFGAVGFMNQANDSNEMKIAIQKKFNDDLESASQVSPKPSSFFFLTNINLTIGEKELLIKGAKSKGLKHCEIFDRERIRIALDSADGFSIRFQYLNIPLSPEEQSSFFARWGDDIQAVISTGFQRVESTLERVLFLQEAREPVLTLEASLELDRRYSAEELGHVRAFCHVFLRGPEKNIDSILFGCCDKSNRTTKGALPQPNGISSGMCGGQWYGLSEQESHDEEYQNTGEFTSHGVEGAKFINVQFSKNSFFSDRPPVSVIHLNDALFTLLINESLAKKVGAIHIFSNDYKLMELSQRDFSYELDEPEDLCSVIPIKFSSEELQDKWMRLRPSDGSSTFQFSFFTHTPHRMLSPRKIQNTLKVPKPTTPESP